MPLPFRVLLVFFALVASVVGALVTLPPRVASVTPEMTAEAAQAPAPAGAAPEPTGPAVTVDRAAVLGPIDDFVYGVNAHLDDKKHTTGLKYPIARWGGNATTRHNWRANTTNRAADWFFMNIPDDPRTVAGKEVGVADHAALTVKATSELLFTIPTIGWTPKDRAWRWGFSVEKYGKQQKTEEWHPDAGNGIGLASKPLRGNDPGDTSRRIGPEWVVEWMRHLKATFGGRAARDGGVRLYSLDNEPDLWHQTHRDLRFGDSRLTSPYLTYDELWQRTLDYAGAIKKEDPDALVTGPVHAVWCDYFTSAADVNDGDGDCKNGADRRAHGGKPLLHWYLEKVCEHQAKTGVRLVDYLDVHFYPENLDLDADDAKAGADRLERVRALYDAGYKDPSWIKEPVRLLPRLKEWAAACPGTKLALTEWRFGWHDGVANALAQAEALAVMGREGVSLATTWGPIAKDGLLEAAYRLYLDFDGKGGNALGGAAVKVAATGVDPATFTAYAIAQDKRTLVYLFNKHKTAAVTPRLALAGDAAARPARLFRLGKNGLETLPAGAATDVPPWSAILAVYEP